MAGGIARREDGLLTDINVTPLVDVVLVLLVLMMVTATAIASRTMGVDVPKAKSGSSAPARPLVVALDEHGTYLVDGHATSEDAVRAMVRARPDVILAADGRTRHELVVHALDVFRSEQVHKIALVVRAEATP
jgi:biopolymer transport protein ExbD